MLIEAGRSVLIIIDVQEALIPAMADARRVYDGCAKLMRAALRLGVPILVSEQYRKGLGPTAGELLALAPEGSVCEKLHFSCAFDPGIAERLKSLGRDQVVLAGIEAHVCVLQTALGLKATGYHPFVVADSCSSRTEANYQAAMARLAACEVGVVTVEMALFEWLHQAGTPEFKDVICLIK